MHWHLRFYIAVQLLSVSVEHWKNHEFFFLGFRQWQSRADSNMNIWLPMFGSTWSQARASTSPHVLAWHMGRDYSNWRASELTDHQVSGLVFAGLLSNGSSSSSVSKNMDFPLIQQLPDFSNAEEIYYLFSHNDSHILKFQLHAKKPVILEWKELGDLYWRIAFCHWCLKQLPQQLLPMLGLGSGRRYQILSHVFCMLQESKNPRRRRNKLQNV